MHIKKLFLYKLYLHSRVGFVFIIGFLVLYSFFFLKKMDMTVFAYNSMFVSKMPDNNTTAYALKINDRLVPISNKLWWKKDFLESSLIGFSEFLENEQATTYLGKLLSTKIKNPVTKQFLLSRLTAQNVKSTDFISHYTTTAGIKIDRDDQVEIIKYQLYFSPTEVRKMDSSVIYIKRSR